jgi:hypothetical protein
MSATRRCTRAVHVPATSSSSTGRPPNATTTDRSRARPGPGPLEARGFALSPAGHRHDPATRSATHPAPPFYGRSSRSARNTGPVALWCCRAVLQGCVAGCASGCGVALRSPEWSFRLCASGAAGAGRHRGWLRPGRGRATLAVVWDLRDGGFTAAARGAGRRPNLGSCDPGEAAACPQAPIVRHAHPVVQQTTETKTSRW